jgi:hypothetical protein
MKPGFRQQAQPSKKDQLRTLQTQVANVEMATRMSQMLVQQLVQNNRNMGDDLNRALNLINELQYKVLAMQSVANLDKEALNSAANDLRIKDFNEAAAKQDAEGNFETINVVEDNSTVLLTSVAKDADGNDRGIFRSRVAVQEIGVPELVANLVGKEVGAKFTATLNGLTHEFEVLGARRPPKEEQKQAEETVGAEPQPVA